MLFRSRCRSSARSMASGEVPMMGTPRLASGPARFSGVWPPNCTITPSGFSRSMMFRTSRAFRLLQKIASIDSAGPSLLARHLLIGYSTPRPQLRSLCVYAFQIFHVCRSVPIYYSVPAFFQIPTYIIYLPLYPSFCKILFTIL